MPKWPTSLVQKVESPKGLSGGPEGDQTFLRGTALRESLIPEGTEGDAAQSCPRACLDKKCMPKCDNGKSGLWWLKIKVCLYCNEEAGTT